MQRHLALAWAEASKLAGMLTGPARPQFHPPSSRMPSAKLAAEPCSIVCGGRGWVGCIIEVELVAGNIPRCFTAPQGLASGCGPSSFVHQGSREGRVGDEAGGFRESTGGK